MKILQTIIGFVTNSSSANYWLNDEVLEAIELEALEKAEAETKTASSSEKTQNKQTPENKTIEQLAPSQEITNNFKNNKQESVFDFFIWIVFSLILIAVLIQRKLKK